MSTVAIDDDAKKDHPQPKRTWVGGFGRWLARYYTSWSWLGFLGCLAGLLPPWTYTSVKMMLLTAAVGGAYIAHYSPKKLVIKNTFPVDIELQGLTLHVADLVTHHVPFFYALVKLPSGGGAYLYWAANYAYYKLYYRDLYQLYSITIIDAALILLVSTGAATLVFVR